MLRSLSRLLPQDEERGKVNRSFLNGLPALRREPHSSVPKRSGPHSRTASQCQTVISLHRLRSFEYRSDAHVFIPVCGQASARHLPFAGSIPASRSTFSMVYGELNKSAEWLNGVIAITSRFGTRTNKGHDVIECQRIQAGVLFGSFHGFDNSARLCN